MAMSVSVAVHSCLESFSNLHEAVSSQILSHDTSPDVSLLLSRSQAAIEDAAGRFRVWSGNIGAHQIPSSKSSLDYRLRDNENIMIRFVSLLQDLNELLQEGRFHSLLQSDTNVRSLWQYTKFNLLHAERICGVRAS